MTYIVFFSGGVSSFEAARRTIVAHGKNNVELWFADTKNEDEDLYRFLDDSEKYFDIKIKRLSRSGWDLWTLFNDQHMIANSRADLCSRVLKREVLNNERKWRFQPNDCVSVFGFDWTEEHRINRVIEAHHPWVCEFPLQNEPRLLKNELVSHIESLGIEPPRLTKLGFLHNNCGGFCVKAGQASFAHLLRMFPDRYNYHAQEELKWQKKHGKTNTILRVQRNGIEENITLCEFKTRIERGLFDSDDWGGCGCMTPTKDKSNDSRTD